MKDTNRLIDIQIEINGVAQVLYGLALQFDDECDTLSPEHMKESLMSIAKHLERIYDDLSGSERKM